VAATQYASVIWEGDLLSGAGKVTAATSGVFKDEAVSWAARTGERGGKTSPEELLAAAHASCFAMALSGRLAKQGAPPRRLEVSAAVTFDKVGEGFKVTQSALEVRGVVEQIDEQAFRDAAEGAKDGCPISQALKGNVELKVKATLGR
jgi:lipoyl-dependent peroxiredoxin